MLDAPVFIRELQKNGVDFFAGVPDSFLNAFCAGLLAEISPQSHIIAANEGNAVALATGHRLGGKGLPLVYMQNSGMGNALNPLASLTSAGVYAVPMLLLIGWRGEPGSGDWAQHALQGEMTPGLLDLLHIPHRVLAGENAKAAEDIAWAAASAREGRTPVALVVPKGLFTGKKTLNVDADYPMSRGRAIEVVVARAPADAIFVATTGRATRELYFLRQARGQTHVNDFLNVGAMGHASSIAMGLALANPGRRVVCLDGDAAAIMHLGALTTVSGTDLPNLLHVVLNNAAHESVGGQPTAGRRIDFTAIAKSAGYQTAGAAAKTEAELAAALDTLLGANKASFVDVWIHKGMEKELPALDCTPGQLADVFLKEE